MAYQNVGTPRFYINTLEWLHHSGGTQIPEGLMTLPVGDSSFGYGADIDVGDTMQNGKNFMAHLNKDLDSSFGITGAQGWEEVINFHLPRESGFTIATFTTNLDTIHIEGTAGSIIVGNYYDMPHSPDLSLNLSYEYDGVKTQETKGGSTLSNANYIKPPNWGSRGCWQIGDVSNLRTGRRLWDLSFSYLSDTDVFPVNPKTGLYSALDDNTTSSYADSDINNNGEFTSNILTGTDFFSQVWNRTIGGHLPFIFQPDNKNNNEFAICRFDMNTLSYKQVANNVYNLKLKIREVW